MENAVASSRSLGKAPGADPSASETHSESQLSEMDTESPAFYMNVMKVVPCAKRFVHDWTECPFAHPQEKARRRDPKLHTYTGIACPSMKKEGTCAFGDHCPYAHNVFEYWLHPTRYRTQLCNDGSNCRRKICFFAHSLDELRVPACKPFVSPEGLAAAAAAAAADNELKRKAAAAGLVGAPAASLSIVPQRASMETPRQSAEWGPVAMPSPVAPSAAADDVPSEGSESPQEERSPASAETPTTPAASPSTFSPHEQQIIEAVTNMLASDKLSASQAATILQQMLPATSLALLQSSLGLGPIPPGPTAADAAAAMDRRTMSDPVPGASFLRADHAPSPFGSHHAAPGGFPGSGFPTAAPSPRMSLEDMASRQSMESARSSFDTARFSFDGRRMSADSAFGATPRGSMEHAPQPYAPPAPAYPQDAMMPRASMEGAPPRPPLPPRPAAPAPAAAAAAAAQRYWTGQQLTTVPEGLPMINTPHGAGPWGNAGRHSTGSVSVDASAAQRLSSDLNRMSFEENAAAAAGGETEQVNPFASSFFAGGGSPAAAASEFFRPGAW